MCVVARNETKGTEELLGVWDEGINLMCAVADDLSDEDIDALNEAIKRYKKWFVLK